MRRRQRQCVWVVKQAGATLYAGDAGVQALAHMIDDHGREVPTITVTHNGHRVWPPVEQLDLSGGS